MSDFDFSEILAEAESRLDEQGAPEHFGEELVLAEGESYTGRWRGEDLDRAFDPPRIVYLLVDLDGERRFLRSRTMLIRTIALTEPARERLLSLSRESEFTFTTLRGTHYRASSRTHHWNRVRCAAGAGSLDLYLATRHYFGWFAWNVLGLDARDIALQFGHQDGGELVRKNYGHADARLARERVREAYRQAPTAPVPLVVSR